MPTGSSYPYYSRESAKAKLLGAVRDGRVRVQYKGGMLTGEAAITALEEDERGTSFVAADVLREFPPLPPAGKA